MPAVGKPRQAYGLRVIDRFFTRSGTGVEISRFLSILSIGSETTIRAWGGTWNARSHSRRGSELSERQAPVLPADRVCAGDCAGDGPAKPPGRSAGGGGAGSRADPVGR